MSKVSGSGKTRRSRLAACGARTIASPAGMVVWPMVMSVRCTCRISRPCRWERVSVSGVVARVSALARSAVAVALIICSVELLSLLADKLDLHGAFWDWIGGLDLNIIGFVIVGLFFATW